MQPAAVLRRNPDISLKEKLKEHYHNRDFTPQQATVNRSGLFATFCAIFSLFMECLIILMPTVYSGVNAEGRTMGVFGWFGEKWWMMLVLVVFLWVEVTWNWWRVYYDVPNWVTKEMKAAHFGQILNTPEGWKHCPTCQLDAPPRSHHCQQCGHCILKRDYHCYFTASCIGFYNQRHFVIFCIYAIWGCAVGLYLQTAYVHLELPVHENLSTYILPVPLFLFVTGKMPLLVLITILHIYVNAALLGAAATFLVWQLFVVLRGQTTHEMWKNIKTYDSGIFRNFTSVFGSPLTTWLLFFAPLKLPMIGDGIKWNGKTKGGKIG